MCCISESFGIAFFVMFRKGFCFAAFVFVVVRFLLDSGRLLGWMLKHFVFCSHPFFSEGCFFVAQHSFSCDFFYHLNCAQHRFFDSGFHTLTSIVFQASQSLLSSQSIHGQNINGLCS